MRRSRNLNADESNYERVMETAYPRVSNVSTVKEIRS